MKSFLGMTVFILVAVLVFSIPDLLACTMCTMSSGDTVLVGNNEDWRDPDTYVWFLPPESGLHGRFYFGFGNRFPQGGMNDQGLCFDGFATPYLAVTQSVNLPVYPGNLIDKAMRECSTVDEVVETFSQYNLEGLERAQLMFVDKSGASAIIEGDSVIYKEGDFQVCTNFYHSNPQLGGWPCWRYNTATSMLQNSSGPSLDLFRRIMDACHQEGNYPTRYSNLYDLTQGIVYLYYFHNFEEFVKIDLEDISENAHQRYHIPSLFAKIKTISPQDGEVLSSTTVTFHWEGEAEHYQLYYSTDPTFSDCDPIDIDVSTSLPYAAAGLGTLFIGLLLPGNFRRFWKKSPSWLIFLMIFLFIYACSDKSTTGSEDTSIQNPKTVTNLQPNTTYYWKVTAQMNPQFSSESIVKTFTTGNQ